MPTPPRVVAHKHQSQRDIPYQSAMRTPLASNVFGSLPQRRCGLAMFAGLFIVALLGCGDDDDSNNGGSSGAAGQAGQSGSSNSAGTSAAANVLEVIPAYWVLENTPLKLLEEGDDIPLDPPPQGGHVLHVGARVTGLTGDTVTIRARLRESDGGTIVAEEERTIVMAPTADDPNAMEPDLRTISQVSHVPVCPDYGERDVLDMPHELEVTITQLYVEPPRQGVGKRKVYPRCILTDSVMQSYCKCECVANYELGKCSNPVK